MVETVNSLLESVPDWLHVLIISMLPIIELRGALPYGVLLLKMPIYKAMVLSIVGNMIPSPFIVYLAKKILDKMMSSTNEKIVGLALKIEQRGLKRSSKIEKYTFWGLVIFVGIPLPGTGVWTGSLIASLLRLDPNKSLLAMLLGTFMASVIVSVLIKMGVMLF